MHKTIWMSEILDLLSIYDAATPEGKPVDVDYCGCTAIGEYGGRVPTLQKSRGQTKLCIGGQSMTFVKEHVIKT